MEIALGARGEADTEAEGLVRHPLFVQVNLCVGVPNFEQASGIQAARPAAEYRDAGESHAPVPCSPCRDVRAEPHDAGLQRSPFHDSVK